MLNRSRPARCVRLDAEARKGVVVEDRIDDRVELLLHLVSVSFELFLGLGSGLSFEDLLRERDAVEAFQLDLDELGEVVGLVVPDLCDEVLGVLGMEF